MQYQILEDNNVSKFIFESDNMIAEAVLYKYNSYQERTVICCSVQSGCKVGCAFCGTGKHFVRNLTSDEIIQQIYTVIEAKVLKEIKHTNDIKKFQIMFMSMGEPFHNYENLKKTLELLPAIFPNAQLLISTTAPLDKPEIYNDFIELSQAIPNIGLQFSIHRSFDEDRNKLIPYKNKMSLRDIRNYGVLWSKKTNRPVYLNYCITNNNTSDDELNHLKDLFDNINFYFTFSVVCSLDKNNKQKAKYDNMQVINKIANNFLSDGYNTRVFNPDGQDTIGGGCGQLWFVQDWLKSHES